MERVGDKPSLGRTETLAQANARLLIEQLSDKPAISSITANGSSGSRHPKAMSHQAPTTTKMHSTVNNEFEAGNANNGATRTLSEIGRAHNEQTHGAMRSEMVTIREIASKQQEGQYR